MTSTVRPSVRSAADLIVLEPCQWFAINTHFAADYFAAGWDYLNGTGGVGATATAQNNGALIDLVNTMTTIVLVDGMLNGVGTTPAVGDRVLLNDLYTDGYQGIYTITDLGSVGTPWILTRDPDNDDAADGLLDFHVGLEGTEFLAVTSRFDETDSFDSDVGTWYGWAVYPNGGFANGYGSLASGFHSSALGVYSVASGYSSVALGHGVGDGGESVTVIGSNEGGTDAPSIGSGGAVVIAGIETTQTDSFTLARKNMGRFIPCNKGSGMDCTIPKQSVVAIPFGMSVKLAQQGAGAVTAVPVDGDVTILGATVTTGAGKVLTLHKVDTNTWWGEVSA